jgi:hypothetical protein
MQSVAVTSPQTRGDKPVDNNEKSIVITWRNENYGQVSGSVAFRATINPYPSEAAKVRVVRAYKSAGFELHAARQAWLAPEAVESIPTTLVEKLEALGYRVAHQGAVPDILEQDVKAAVAPASGLKM